MKIYIFNKSNLIFIPLLLLSFLLHNNLYSQDKKKIILLNFYNIEQNKDFSYLENTIPETVKQKLIETNQYEILDSSNIINTLAKNENNIDLYNPEIVSNHSKKLNAEAVVIGSFQVFDGHLQLNSKIIDVNTGLIKGVLMFHEDIGIEIFDAIDNFSISLVEKIQKAVPINAPKIIIKKETKTIKKKRKLLKKKSLKKKIKK